MSYRKARGRGRRQLRALASRTRPVLRSGGLSCRDVRAGHSGSRAHTLASSRRCGAPAHSAPPLPSPPKAPWTVPMKRPSLCPCVLPPRSKPLSASSLLPKGFAGPEGPQQESHAGESRPVSALPGLGPSQGCTAHTGPRGEGSGRTPLWAHEPRPEGGTAQLGRSWAGKSRQRAVGSGTA